MRVLIGGVEQASFLVAIESAVAARGRAGTVFVTSLEGTPQAVFTDAAQYDGPAWSPDGTRVAFGSNRAGTWAIRVAPGDGSGARAITPNQLVEVHAPTLVSRADRASRTPPSHGCRS